MASWRVDVVHEGKDRLGEGPLWCPESRRLWWLDIFDAELCSYDPASGKVETRRLAHKVHALARAGWPWFVGTAHKLGVSWVNLESGAFAAMQKDGTFKGIFARYFPRKKLPGPAVEPR